MSWQLVRGDTVVRTWDRYTKKPAVYWLASMVAKSGDEIRLDGRVIGVFPERDNGS